MTALLQDTTEQVAHDYGTQVTSISITARIDYVLRFSKHQVLVVDEHGQDYSAAASQFLSTLSHSSEKLAKNSINVAFVAASAKLNDIQMRCRIVEQLFSNTLFDPEQSLAVSILKLAKPQNESITIIVEHAQSLSLQLSYELNQLVELAKKSGLTINTVLFGDQQAAEKIAASKSIFKDRISILDAKTGQLLNISHPKFNDKATGTDKKLLQRILLAIAIVAIFTIASYIGITSYKTLGLTSIQSPVTSGEANINPISNTIKEDEKSRTVLVKNESNNQAENVGMKVIENSQRTVSLANNSEILQALQMDEVVDKIIEAKPAKAQDILLALSTKETNEQVVENITKEIDQASSMLHPDYYLASTSGYIIQIAGFYKESLWRDFVINNELEFYSYQRKLKDKVMYVVTSKLYKDKETANIALKALPAEILARGPWIKSNLTVHDEINTFKH